jgi:hypothetical protein
MVTPYGSVATSSPGGFLVRAADVAIDGRGSPALGGARRPDAVQDQRAMARLDLYWIPLGAGARVVRASGWLYEAAIAAVQRRPRADIYHAALVAELDGVRTTIEVAPTFDDRGCSERGVVGSGPVGVRFLGRFELFRYEIRCWPGGIIPDLAFAVASPVELTNAPADIDAVVDIVARVPTPVWGRDELGAGEMWNSNSVVSWVLARCKLLDRAGSPPERGRAPGWRAGIVAADRGLERD